MYTQHQIDRITQHIEDIEMLLECCPRDEQAGMVQLESEYEHLLEQRLKLIKERDSECKHTT